ncbi:hypothetical protein CPC08DRAFT_226985 [Agrocybe pediades]|nr:hypothetical protein CPC08DRAFT_226985 [Agrocybe pediades]
MDKHPLISQRPERQYRTMLVVSACFSLICELLFVFRGQDLRTGIIRPVYSIILSRRRGWVMVKECPKHVEVPPRSLTAGEDMVRSYGFRRDRSPPSRVRWVFVQVIALRYHVSCLSRLCGVRVCDVTFDEREVFD